MILAVVADGMGGHLAGDVASKMTTDLLQTLWEQDASNLNTPEKAEAWFETNVKHVNQKVFQYANENPECQGMGTTLVAAICSNEFATVAHVGDSRCYILNKNGFRQLTDDHSLVNELVKSGQISKEDAENHPRKNVLLRAIGTESTVSMDTKSVELEIGDTLILCSDGLTNKISDRELEEILRMNNPIAEKADQLILLANEYGGEDNISLAIIYNFADEKVGG